MEVEPGRAAVRTRLSSSICTQCESRSDSLCNRNEVQTEEPQPQHERDSFPCEIIRQRFLGEIMWDLGVVVMLGTEGLPGLRHKLKAYFW